MFGFCDVKAGNGSEQDRLFSAYLVEQASPLGY